MKKLVLLIVMFLPLFTVSAEEWQEVEEIPVVNGSTLEIKEEKEYQWYKIKKEGGYFKEAPSEEFLKTGFWILSPWSDWQEDYPTEKDMIETKVVYHYQLMKKIKYIRLSEKNNSNLTFATISIYNGRNPISYKLKESETEVILELGEPCYFDDLEVEMTLVNENNEENAFLIEWLYELDLPSCMQTYTRQWFDLSVQLSFIERKMMPNQALYEAEQTSLEKVGENLHTKVYQKKQYRYQERLYYYEKEIKEYSNKFSSTMIEGYPYPDLQTERKRLFCKYHEVKQDPIIIEKIVEIPVDRIVVKEVPIEKIVMKEIPIEKLVVKEVPVETVKIKEVPIEIPIEKVIQNEIPITIKEENKQLEQEIKNLKYRIAVCQNEKSEKLEKESVKNQPVKMKKQSLEMSIHIVMFMLGYLLGRIVTMKKKF